ncbi:hypothetical protein YY92_08815 [Campylobacter fetus]|uniref:lipid-binding SYLF domain-containing protein n=1 Tax=Campylobacter fetus TaxID=196 RepID=UPI0011C9FB32|nr:lipid-binding SYLF domain-containing protein [Campylobacter fetus]EAJ1232816.1 hypothetical protein [Campylobacter fetus]EAK0414811.1 hypothetical protein [Campylobacter fetus]TXF09925.1 lipid-binding SYLF domain-containing protein [Campylobacter fetus subsp. fetus]
MKKIFLGIVFCFSILFANDELLLDSANAYKVVLQTNSVPSAQLIEKSSAILVFPKFVKVGFILGATVGRGVMMVKQSDGWMPIGVKIGGASLGLQAGYESSYLVIYVLKKSIIQDIKDTKFTVGADASISFMDSGANRGKMSDFTFSNDMYAYSNNSGFFAGAKLGGSVITLDDRSKFDINSYGFNALIEAFMN